MEIKLIEDWRNLAQIAISTAFSYLLVLAFIRISGKRTLAKITAFDFIVTIALGSILGSMSLGKIPVLEGFAAIVVIVAANFLIAHVLQTFKSLNPIVNAKPTILFYKGQYLEEEMKKAVITKEEIYAEVRKNRILDLDTVEAVVLEQNGILTVVLKSENVGHSSLSDLQ